jgi:hypothetical protein
MNTPDKKLNLGLRSWNMIGNFNFVKCTFAVTLCEFVF